MNISSEIQEKARLLIKGNRKIEAIKLVKDYSKCGLKEAKDYVDQLPQPISTSKISSDNLDNQLLQFLAEDKKINAVKFYKDESGLGLAESLAYIDGLINNQHKETKPQNIRETDIQNLVQQSAEGNNSNVKIFLLKLTIGLIIAIALIYFILK